LIEAIKTMEHLDKLCPICKEELPMRKLFNKQYPSYAGHEKCVEIMNTRDQDIREQKRAIECRLEMEAELYGCFAGASINPARRTWELWSENSENKAVTEFLRQWRYPNKGMVLSGGTGIGKTHILTAIAIAAFWQQGVRFKFIRVAEWADDLRSCQFERAKEMVTELKRASIVLFDDLGAGIITDHVESKLCMILDHRLEFNLPTFFSTNLSSDDMDKLFSARIMSRISGLCEWINLSAIKSDWRYK